MRRSDGRQSFENYFILESNEPYTDHILRGADEKTMRRAIPSNGLMLTNVAFAGAFNSGDPSIRDVNWVWVFAWLARASRLFRAKMNNYAGIIPIAVIAKN